MSILPVEEYVFPISEFLKGDKENTSYEVEVRFRPLNFGGAERSMAAPFRRLESFLEAAVSSKIPLIKGAAPTSSFSVNLYDENYTRDKSTYRVSKNRDAGTELILIKRSQAQEIKEYGVLLSYATEEKIEKLPDRMAEEEVHVRSKARRSFLISRNGKGIIRFDLTVVDPMDSGTGSAPAGSSYEVEAECLSPIPEDVAAFCEIVDTAFLVLHNTKNLYSLEDRKAVYSLLIKNYGTERTESIIARPIDLKFGAVASGGLVGGKYPYFLTYKTDGIRKFLVLDAGRTWLIFGDEANLIFPSSSLGLNGYIFDGEVTVEKNGVTTFQAFDCLLASGKNMTSQEYKRRYEQVEFIVKSYKKVKEDKKQVLNLTDKRTEELSLRNFFQTVRSFRDERKGLPYTEDGLIFQSGGPYPDPKKGKEDKSLTIYKWKDPKDLTIDFRAMEARDGLYLTTAEGDNFAPEGKIFKVPKEAGIQSGQVGEFEFRDGGFRLRKLRMDKLKPNRKEVALSVWASLSNPMSEDDLCGRTLKLAYKYHNRVKAGLWASAPKGATVLDIGSGRGGDLSKMGPDKILYAVEPDKDNLAELVKRSEARKDGPSLVYPILAGGEEVEEIRKVLKNKVEVISFMLSLTFFWQNSKEGKKRLDDLFTTIKTFAGDSCTILFMSADGEAMKALFDKHGPHVEFPGKATLDYEAKHEKVKIHLPDSIVTDQTEYLFNYKEFSERLQALGFRSTADFFATEEPLLTEEQKEYSALYRCGIFKRMEGSQLSKRSQLSRRSPGSKPLSNLTPGLSEVLVHQWPNVKDLVRIGCIPEGSCFIHALLTAIYPPYQKISSRAKREDMAALFRRDLAKYLTLKSEKFKGAVNWETIRDGMFPKAAMLSLMSGEKNNVFLLDKAVRFLNSTEYIGEDTIAFISEYLGIDIYIVQAYEEDVHVYRFFLHLEPGKPKLIINYTTNHYETIAIKGDKGYQTIFSASDPAIQHLNSQASGVHVDSYEHKTLESIYEDGARLAFANAEGEVEVPKAFERLDKEDLLYKRLLPALEKIKKDKLSTRSKSPRLSR